MVTRTLFALVLAHGALAGAMVHVPASRLATGPIAVTYETGPKPEPVVQIEGLRIDDAAGVTLTVESRRPTQLRIYHVPERGPCGYRYVVLSAGALARTLSAPLAAFDPDRLADIVVRPAGGSLRIVDAPGLLRVGLTNTVTLSAVAVTTAPAPPAADELPAGPELDADPLYAKTLGGWLGKAAGGAAGTPLEGEREPRWAYREKLSRGLLGYVWGYGPDDDLSFEVRHLLMFEKLGNDFEARDIAAAWRSGFARELLWHSEREALAAIDRGTPPLQAGRGRYGDSLCARIRADLWGLLAPGDPDRALLWVARDAPVSNRDEGVRDAEWVATLVSLAFTAASVDELFDRALARMPGPGDPLVDVVRRVRADVRGGAPVERTYAWLRDEIYRPLERADPTDAWVRARPNAGLVALALLSGRGDFGRTVGLAACLGWDADCNAATAGAVLGVLGGPAAIPPAFRDPLHDRLRVGVAGREHWSLRRLAALTRALARHP